MALLPRTAAPLAEAACILCISAQLPAQPYSTRRPQPRLGRCGAGRCAVHQAACLRAPSPSPRTVRDIQTAVALHTHVQASGETSGARSANARSGTACWRPQLSIMAAVAGCWRQPGTPRPIRRAAAVTAVSYPIHCLTRTPLGTHQALGTAGTSPSSAPAPPTTLQARRQQRQPSALAGLRRHPLSRACWRQPHAASAPLRLPWTPQAPHPQTQRWRPCSRCWRQCSSPPCRRLLWPAVAL